MSEHDDNVLRQIVARLVLPIAWLLATGRRYSHKVLAVRVMESLTPAERDAAVEDWADRRRLEQERVTDPAERTLHGVMLLVRPAVERLRGLGYATFGADFEMQYQLDGKKWRASQWGPQIEAICAASAGARKAVEPVATGGKLGKAEALSRIHAALPGDWDRVLRGVVADELLAAVQPDPTDDTDDTDNGQVPPQTEPVAEPVVSPSAGAGAEGADGGQENDNVQDQNRSAPEPKPAEQQPTALGTNMQAPLAAEATPAGRDARVSLAPVAGLRLHEEAGKIPGMRDEEWGPFLADVQTAGVKDPITVQRGGVVLDGRNRLRAARESGQTTIPAIEVDWSPAGQLEHIYRSALLRRHLSDDQRAVLAARFHEELRSQSKAERARKAGKAGGRGRSKAANSSEDKASPGLSGEATPPQNKPRSRALAAAVHNLPERKVRDADEVQRKDPELAD
jgi:hypothetical protein